MGDTWLDPDTCGVKLAEFEHMTRQMTQAAPKLAELADKLWQALHAAQVSTAPAMEIKRIAAWADKAASDLRRRNQLAHDLDRQKLAFVVCHQDGDYLKLPDRYTDQVAYAAGRRSADLFRRAAAGDPEAKAALRRLHAEDITPMFAKGLLEALGPEALLKLPMDLIVPLAADVRHNREGADANAAETRATLALLGRSLALATRPDTGAYLGDDYLRNLTLAGRKNFPPLSTPPNGTSGYQSLGALLTAAGDTRFSTHFIEVVGSDMIAYDSRLRLLKTVGEEPLPTLAGKAGLGNALEPATTKVVPDDRKTDFLAPLLTAAAVAGEEASQALLTHVYMGPFQEGTEPSFKGSTLQYLLHDRRSTWSRTDHGAALGQTLRTAAMGRDEQSSHLAFVVGGILAADARKYFGVTARKELEIKDSDGLDALSGLRPAMAEVLAAHITEINGSFDASGYALRSASSPLSDAELDHLLLYVTRDAAAFTTLLTAQTAHAKLAVDHAIANGANWGNVVTAEGEMFGRLLEIRNQNLAAEGGRLTGVYEDLRNMVEFGVTLLPTGEGYVDKVPGIRRLYPFLVDKLRKEMVDWITRKLAEHPKESVFAPTTNVEAVEDLLSLTVASSMVAHGVYSKRGLEGQSFVVKGSKSEVMPPRDMSPRQVEQFLQWAREYTGLNSMRIALISSIDAGGKSATGHFRDSDGNVLPTGQR